MRPPTERRSIQRIDRHLPVSFDAAGRRGRGVTSNLAAGGLQIKTASMFAPGTRLRCRLALDDRNDIAFEAEVVWAHKAEGPTGLAAQNTLGVEFWGPPDERYYDYLRRAWEEQHPGRPAAPKPQPAAAAEAPPPHRPRSTPGGRGAVASTGRGATAGGRSAGDAAATSTPPRPPRGKRGSAPARRASPLREMKPGAEGLSVAVAGATDWTVGVDPREEWLSMAMAAALIERASVRAVSPTLPRGYRTVGESVVVTVLHESLSARGATVVTRATVVEVSPANATLTFEAELLDGDRVIARGRHVRSVVRE